MSTTEKILQTMNSWQSGEVIAVRRKKCSGASSRPTPYPPHSHTDKEAYQSCDWAKVKCMCCVRIVTLSHAMSDNDNESW